MPKPKTQLIKTTEGSDSEKVSNELHRQMELIRQGVCVARSRGRSVMKVI